ncbi:3-dehydroquinate synthase [Stackebrandtia soli]|uniref:3-dehydroquinate synthase n=1 Tax=Stackebrandtia soli TaxID=1892856 RepID=UPI0039E777BF
MTVTIVLVGPPGSGKTTVGARLAALLDVPFRDTDQDIEAAAGKPIPEIFIDHGESHFRALEAEAVASALAEHSGVLALGGGAVLSPETRRLLADAPVAFLSVELAAAVSRVGLGVGRPLLAINPRATMKALLDERRPLYGEVADTIVATDDLDVDEVTSRLAEWLGAAVTVPVGTVEPYDVVIGPDTTALVTDYLAQAKRVAIIHSAPLSAHAASIATYLGDAAAATLIEIPDAEAGKTIEVAATCWDRLGEAGFTRTDVVIGVGGGAVTDLAGFVAACWLRGVRVIQLPTSLLGMVDAAVGGKTGVNTSAGKNLVGAFHAPSAVLCDLSVLESQPVRDRVAGLAEIVKCGFIADPRILDLVEASSESDMEPGSPVLAELIRRAVAVKAAVVTEDFKESGRRAFLNYGHTFAHAVERVRDYTVRHGDAVALGMVFAAALGRLTGRVDVLDRTRSILDKLGLPTRYDGEAFAPLLAVMRLDKKAVGDLMRFVLLDAIGEPTLVSDVTFAQLEAAFEEVSR